MNKFETNTPHLITKEGDKVLFPFGPQIFQSEISDNFREELLNKGKLLTKEKNDWRQNLAGIMRRNGSYIYEEDFILKSEPYLLSFCERWFEKVTDNFGPNQTARLLDVQEGRRAKRVGKLRIDTMWINYQHQYDFNPVHTHRGVLSFVIFCQVPKRIFTKQAVSNTKDSGKILFLHGEEDHPFASTLYPVTPYENLIFIFPNNLHHTVPPFFTDDERISVSGNFVVV